MKIENAFELQSIYITRSSVRLILVSNQAASSNVSVTDYIIDEIPYILAKVVIIRLG